MIYPIIVTTSIIILAILLYEITTVKKKLSKRTFVVGYDEENEEQSYHIKMETKHGVFDRFSNSTFSRHIISKEWATKLSKDYTDEKEAEKTINDFLTYLSAGKNNI